MAQKTRKQHRTIFVRRFKWITRSLLFFVFLYSSSITLLMIKKMYLNLSHVSPGDEQGQQRASRCKNVSTGLHCRSSCDVGQPCTYSDKVDLRIIVTTYNRSSSLQKLLKSLDTLELDSHTAKLEIWIDRNYKTGEVDEQTVKVASEFKWSRGPTCVHVHLAHVGIYGQWIDTWRPHDDCDDELALIVEDDLSLSMYAYRWVLAVFRAYSHRNDFAGASLTSHQMTILSPRPSRPLAGPRKHPVMMYKCFGTWGFAPKPMHWRNFQV